MAVALHELVSAAADPWTTWVPVASAVIAALSMAIAFANRKTARKALRLSELQEERRAARLDLKLLETISWRPARENWRIVGLRVLAVNPTDRDGSLISAELGITYKTRGGLLMVVKIPHQSAVKGLPEGIAGLDIPARIPSNGAISGWLVYKIDNGVIGEAEIQGYDAVVHDSRGVTERIPAWIMREVNDAETT